VTTTGLTIDDSARFLGHATWLERRLFEAVGEWVRSTPEPAVKLAFARQSRHHGRHAELLEPVRPETRDHDPEQRAPLDPSWRRLIARLLAAKSTAQRLDHLGEILRLTTRCYEEHLVRMSPVRDGPVRRAVLLVLEDERAALAEVEALRAAAGIGAGSAAAGR
jgi:hypothetical protein